MARTSSKKKCDAAEEVAPPAPSPERASKAADLRPLIGQEVNLTWSVASQQLKQNATGFLEKVTDRHVEVYPVNGVGRRLYLPLSFIIRYAQ